MWPRPNMGVLLPDLWLTRKMPDFPDAWAASGGRQRDGLVCQAHASYIPLYHYTTIPLVCPSSLCRPLYHYTTIPLYHWRVKLMPPDGSYGRCYPPCLTR